MSYGIAVAARNLPVARGQNVVLTHEQFPGNVHAWTRAAREAGAEVRFAMPPASAGRGAAWNEHLLEQIDAATAVVAVPHVHWTDGTRFDLVEVGRRCREVGAALVVDGTQSVGALPFDVKEVRPDALVVAAYKWLLGPYSVGMGWYGERFDAGVPLEETWIGREASEDFQHLVNYRDGYQPGALRYDVAERSNFALLPMAVASLRLVSAMAPGAYPGLLPGAVAGVLAEAAGLGFAVEDEAWRAGHLFGLRMPPGLDLVALKEALERRSVVASLRGYRPQTLAQRVQRLRRRGGAAGGLEGGGDGAPGSGARPLPASSAGRRTPRRPGPRASLHGPRTNPRGTSRANMAGPRAVVGVGGQWQPCGRCSPP